MILIREQGRSSEVLESVRLSFRCFLDGLLEVLKSVLFSSA